MGISLVTGSAGHLGEALMRSLALAGNPALGLDVTPSPWTGAVGSITDRGFVREAMRGVDLVYHAATLHKPHVATHGYEAFVDTNVRGTLILLEEAVAAGVSAFICTSTTSAFGSALAPPPGAPAAWIAEDVRSVPKNIYGATKTAAEDLCELFARRHRLPCIVLRTSRFFPEVDDNAAIRAGYELLNAQANEFLYRRVDLADLVEAHRCAAARAGAIGFARYVVSATTPFEKRHALALRKHPHRVVSRIFPAFERLYARAGWRMFDSIDRVYDNRLARLELGWTPRYDFGHVLSCLERGLDFRSPLAREVGSKGYHAVAFADGPYPVT
jgi:UDP-glucose 4-epimerase